MKACILSILLVFALSGPLCAAGESQRIIIAGTGDSQLLLREMAAAFEKRHPGVVVEVPESIGTSGGIKAVAKGECDLARTARPLRGREVGYGLRTEVFALSPVVMAANLPTRCLDGLTSAQLVGIYTGEITLWSEIDGACPDHKIYVANREEGDSSREAMKVGVDDFAGIDHPVGGTLYTTPETLETLEATPFVIGYIPLSALKASSLRVLSLDGVSPGEEEVRRGEYRPTTPFGLAWKGELSGVSKAFVDFVFSPEGIALVRGHGAVPVERNGK